METKPPMEEPKADEPAGESPGLSAPNGVMDISPVEEPTAVIEDEALSNHLIDVTSVEEPKAEEIPAEAPVASAPNGLIDQNVEQTLEEASVARNCRVFVFKPPISITKVPEPGSIVEPIVEQTLEESSVTDNLIDISPMVEPSVAQTLGESSVPDNMMDASPMKKRKVAQTLEESSVPDNLMDTSPIEEPKVAQTLGESPVAQDLIDTSPMVEPSVAQALKESPVPDNMMDISPMVEPSVAQALEESPVAEDLMDPSPMEEPKVAPTLEEAPVAHNLIDPPPIVEPRAVAQALEEPSVALPNNLMAPIVVADEPPIVLAPNALMDIGGQPVIEPNAIAAQPAPLAGFEGFAELRITPLDKLLRFCYIGDTKVACYVPPTAEIVTMRKFRDLRDLCGRVCAEPLGDCLVSVLINNADYLPRPDEALLVLAVYLSSYPNALQKTVLRRYIPRLVRTDKELFLFTRFVRQVQVLQGRPNALNRTSRRGVVDWYKEKSPGLLLEMWSKGEEICASHRDLLRRCHYRGLKQNDEIKATLRLFSTPTRELQPWPNFLNPMNEYKQLIEAIVKLRMTRNALEALPVLNELSITFEQVPDRLRYDPVLAEKLLPTMSYEQLLKTSPRVLRHYRRAQRALHTQYEEMLLDMSKLEAANIAPMQILLGTTRLHSRNRQLGAAIRPNFLFNAYAASFGHNKALGKRLHITLNIENLYLNKYLNGRNRFINYLDALVSLAFGYYKNDSDICKVNFWSDRQGNLKPLPWTNSMTVIEATECCKAQAVRQTKQIFTEVINSAFQDKTTYDVFLVVVPAATRANPNNSSARLATLLDEYRNGRNSNTKLIIVSLRRSKASMEYSVEYKQNVLELCGLSEQTPSIINAFACSKFN